MAAASYDGSYDIRQRDAYHPEYARTTVRQGPMLRPMQEFQQGGTDGKPVCFRPNGSFEALRQQGKLSDPRTLHGEDARHVMREKKYFMPGYTGFVRGQQHISGRTYGEMTRRAYDTPFDTHVRTSPVPSGPHQNRKIPHRKLENTFVTNNLSHRKNHVPGYTGHVPGARATFSKTFGETTLQEMDKFARSLPDNCRRPNAQERPDFAHTSKPRALLPIDSAPLPGTTYATEAPVKMIPGGINYLKFFPM